MRAFGAHWLLLLAGLVSARHMQNERFVVLRATTEDWNQLATIRRLHDEMHLNELDFWLTPTSVGHKADIMVAESRLDWLESTLNTNNVSYVVSIDDVEKLILLREGKPKNLGVDVSKRLNDEYGNRARYGFGEYHPYATIVAWMRDVERKYPDRAQVFSSGVTFEGRPIYGIKIGREIGRTDKRVFWVDGGIHAREWAAVHTVVYFIDRLIADYDDDALVRAAVDNIHFYLIPVLNPDGYEFSRSDVSPTIRLWRKNRAGVFCKKDRWFRDRCCGGVDLNRNFDWFFGEIGSSNEKCSEIYQGSGAFSEAESRAVRDMMFSPALKGKVDGFMTLHTYSQMWIHPFSHRRKSVPEDIAEIEQVGRAAVAALENTFGTRYRFGTGADILYPSSGGSDDWAKGKGGAKFVYLVELRPGEEVWDGFILDQRQLVPTAKETWNGVKVVVKAVLDRLPRRSRDPLQSTSTGADVLLEPVQLTSSSLLLTPPPPPSTTTTTTTTTTTRTTTTTMTPPATTTTSMTTTMATPISLNIRPAQGMHSTQYLDAFYVLGKRKFKFVSIDKFVYATTPTTPTTSTPTSPNPPLVPQVALSLPFELSHELPQAASDASSADAKVDTMHGDVLQNTQRLVADADDDEDDAEANTDADANPVHGTSASSPNSSTEPFEGGRPQPMTSLRRRTRPLGRRPVVVAANARTSAIVQRLRQQQFAVQQRLRGRPRIAGRPRTPLARPQVAGRTNVGAIRTSACVDRSPWCASWRSTTPQVCRVSFLYMQRDCARTCGFCK